MKNRLTTLLFLVLAGGTALAGAWPDYVGASTARTKPYSFVGRLLFRSGDGGFIGSATVIRPKSTLTAAHNLWDRQNGWSTSVRFERARYGDTYLLKAWASEIVILAGYASSVRQYGAGSRRAFAKDIGGVKFGQTLAGGAAAGYKADPSLLEDTVPKISLGYGAETHSGRELLYSDPDETYYSAYGAYWLNDSYFLEAGMSGGPVFHCSGNPWNVIAVNVSGSDYDCGVRVLNSSAASFISSYLQ